VHDLAAEGQIQAVLVDAPDRHSTRLIRLGANHPSGSAEFIEFLKLADAHYPTGARIRVVLDNHSAHISKETRAFLATVPNRFEFTFTPKHGSWLNLIESFFGKMAKTLLRHIRVASAKELQARIERHLQEVNETPVVFRWKYKLETLSVV
jgi:transposase